MERIPWEVVNSHVSDAYIAGFLDGDGSVVAVITKQDIRRYPNRPLRIQLKVNFTQHERHKSVLVAIQRHFNGIGYLRRIFSHHLSELVITKRADVKMVLERLLPHLFLKQTQARIALTIIAVCDKGERGPKNALIQTEFEKNLSMAMKIRALNSAIGGKKSMELINPVTT